MVAAEALDVRFAEEVRGFGEGAEFAHEVCVWDVGFAVGDWRPVVIGRVVVREFGQAEPFPPRSLFFCVLFFPAYP